MELSLRWARRCSEAHAGSSSALFGIVQGGMYPALRERSAQALIETGFDGYAIGGLSVGEPPEDRLRVLDNIMPRLPRDAPRYLMGVGTPEDLVEAVSRGVDMFDCVMRRTRGRLTTIVRATPAATTVAPISSTWTSVARCWVRGWPRFTTLRTTIS